MPAKTLDASLPDLARRDGHRLRPGITQRVNANTRDYERGPRRGCSSSVRYPLRAKDATGSRQVTLSRLDPAYLGAVGNARRSSINKYGLKYGAALRTGLATGELLAQRDWQSRAIATCRSCSPPGPVRSQSL